MFSRSLFLSVCWVCCSLCSVIRCVVLFVRFIVTCGVRFVRFVVCSVMYIGRFIVRSGALFVRFCWALLYVLRRSCGPLSCTFR